MTSRLEWPSWCWLALAVPSCSASFLAWNGQRADARGRNGLAAESQTSADSRGSSDAAIAAALPAAQPLVSEAEPSQRQPPVALVPRLHPTEPGNGTTVLRCTVRGRATYIDVAAACPDGSAGKITVLSR